MAGLGEALHEIMACSRITHKTKSTETLEKWDENASRAQATLKEIRPKLKYPLWGLDEGLNIMTRVPDWNTHYKNDPELATQFLDKADALRKELDDAVRISYSTGNPPSRFRAWRVSQAVAAITKFRDGTGQKKG